MMSHYERRQLEQIEQGLASDDPLLTLTLAENWLVRYQWLLMASGVFGSALLVLGIICASAELAVGGLLIAGGGFGLVFWQRVRQRRQP